MTDKLLKLLVCAVISVASLSGCTISTSSGGLDESDQKMIKDQIRAELAEMPSFDSIASTPIIVSPTITVRDGIRDSVRDIVKMFVICIPFLFTIAVLWLVLHYKRINMLSKYNLINLSLEKGTPLPDSFFTGGKNPDKVQRRKQLNNGMMWIAFGISGIIFCFVGGAEEPCAMCIFPVLVGIAKIISYCIDNKSANSGNTGLDAD